MCTHRLGFQKCECNNPVAALVDARFDKICDRLEASFSDVPEDEGLAEIDEAVSGERAERIGNSKA